MILTTTGILTVESIEDGGSAIITEPFSINTGNSDDENGLTVRINSWDENNVHADLNLLKGKKINIIIEVL